jgi:methionyl-tRNA formyltransferase
VSRISIFMGTGTFAVPALEALHDLTDISHVFTKPDKPAGRGQRTTRGVVAAVADSLGISVVQPDSFREPDVRTLLVQVRPEVIVVASYGLFLPRWLLQIPPHGCLNIHPSLLPRHRGPSPVAAAILTGDEVTGVSLMLMNSRMDAGPIVAQSRRNIEPEDTSGNLTAKLAVDGAQLLRDCLDSWFRAGVDATPQQDEDATYSPLLTKHAGRIDWTMSVDELVRRVRAFDPWPGSFTTWEGQTLRIVRARAASIGAAGESPGTVIECRPELLVQTGTGVLTVDTLQLQGSRALSTADFVRGHASVCSTVLGQ